MNARRVLIIRLGAMGDVVHALPVARRLATAGLESVGWLIEDRWAPLAEAGAPGLRLHLFPRGKWTREGTGLGGKLSDLAALRRELRAGGYDAAVDLQGLTKSALAGWFSGAGVRIGFGDSDARELSRLFYSSRVTPPPEARHVLERNLALLAGLSDDLAAGPVEFGLGVPDDALRAARGSLARAGVSEDEAYAIIQPGAGWPTKRWLQSRYGELSKLLRSEYSLRPVVSWAGAEERRLAEEVRFCSGERAVLAPETDLRALMALMGGAALVVGGDTGPVHLAAAMGRPTVGIYAATDVARNGPYGPRVQTVTSPLACSGCWLRRCSKSPECMKAVTTGMVASAVEDLLVSRDGSGRIGPGGALG